MLLRTFKNSNASIAASSNHLSWFQSFTVQHHIAGQIPCRAGVVAPMVDCLGLKDRQCVPAAQSCCLKLA